MTHTILNNNNHNPASRRTTSAHPSLTSGSPLKPTLTPSQPRHASASAALRTSQAHPQHAPHGLSYANTNHAVGIGTLLPSMPSVSSTTTTSSAPLPAIPGSPSRRVSEGGVSESVGGESSSKRCASEDDEVWHVLDALEECNLRASRGMGGLSAGSKRTSGSRGTNRGGHYLDGPALSPGQQFVAKWAVKDSKTAGKKR